MFNAEELQNPVEFTKRLLTHADGSSCIPHAAQEQLLLAKAPRITAVTGRQVGKSTAMAWRAVWMAVTHPNNLIMIVAPSLEQSRIIINIIVSYFEKPPLSVLLKGKIKQYPFPELQLHNNSRIIGRGGNSPQYIRGNSPNLVIVDEAAFIKEGVIREMEPMLSVTGQTPDAGIILISSPFGDGTFRDWYERGQEANQSRHLSYKFGCFANPYADKAGLDAIREEYGEDSILWQTEYLGNFIDSEMSVFSSESIKDATANYPTDDKHQITFPQKPIEQHRYVAGVDLANQIDYFVSAMLDATDIGHKCLVRLDRYQKRSYTYYRKLIKENYYTYNHAKTLVDSTTLAESFLEDLQDIHAEGYKFTSGSKYELIQELVKAFDNRELLIPPDKNLIAELTYFQYKISASKTLRMEAKRGHDDIVVALALANKHANGHKRNIGFFQTASRVMNEQADEMV